MPTGIDRFDLDATLQMVSQAATAVVCNICFSAACHGLAIAALVAGVGLVLKLANKKIGRPMMMVAAKLSLACLILAIPGAIYLLQAQH